MSDRDAFVTRTEAVPAEAASPAPLVPPAAPDPPVADPPAPAAPRAAPPRRPFSAWRGARELAAIEVDSPARSTPIREGERTSQTLGRDALHRRLLAAGDMGAAALALVVAILAGGGSPTIAIVAALPLIVLLSKLVGLYDRDDHVLRKTTLDEAPALFQISMAFTFVAWLADDLLASATLTKPQVLLAWSILFLSMGLARTGARQVALRLAPAERLLVLGSVSEASRVAEKLAAVTSVRAEVVGRVPMAHEPTGNDEDGVLGTLPDLDYVLRSQGIDRVVICAHGESTNDMLDTIRLVKGLGVKVSVMPRLFEVVGSSVEFDDLGGMTLLGLRRYELTKSSAFIKRAFDVVGAGVGLLVLSPLLATIALTIKLTSSGPVLFRQHRVGRGGDAFDMLKFRTMYDGADAEKAELLHRNEADGFFKIAEDPRVTPVGRLLRRCSLDELPQLVNVLRGQMSLVGPRPLVSEEDARIEGFFRRRLDVMPGMTGAWQVLGSARIPMRDMITIDYLYRANWSLWLDIKILLRTIPHVVSRRGM